jgi:sec-independent protein translocase protein TatB
VGACCGIYCRLGSTWTRALTCCYKNSKPLGVHELHENLKKAEQQGLKDLSPDLQNSVSELQQAAQSVTHSYKKSQSQATNNQQTDDSK